MKTLILLLSFFALTFAQNLELVKGQAVFLEFDKSLLSLKNEKNELSFFKHPTKNDKVVAIFSLAYKNPPKESRLIASYKDKKEIIIIKTLQGNYKSEKIVVESKKAFPPKNEQNRIKEELQEANKIYGSYTNEALFNGTFNKPLNSKITSSFGKARVFNEKLASYHSGTDFKASMKTPIYATNSGIVRLAKERYFAGISIIIDHGYGIYSQYYHLSSTKLKVGQKVKKGEFIGLSGNSGRVSGPHLHFGIFAGGKQVDPLDFIAKFNKLFNEI